MPGTLVLMGSGETSPTMVEVHRSAVRALGARPRAVLLDTPYGFQENAADISARARRYFAHSVGLEVQVGTDIAGADWVFSGPGSPTYALDRWTATSAAADLRARVRARAGVTVLASAAACTAGAATVPVYEIYKVGAEPHWREGLDLLGVIGLRAVVIPHYDNAEGGTHDTRFCYLGERRLSRMELELPDDVAVLGIDEHTAVVIDLASGELEVAGRGGLTVRRRGSATVLPAGSRSTVTGLGELTRSGGDMPPAPMSASTPHQTTLEETTRSCAERFDAALDKRDAAAATLAVLDLEDAVARWSADTEEDAGGVGEAREILRRQIARLGGLVDLRDPQDLLRQVVNPLLALRGELRRAGDYAMADSLRRALNSGGVVIEDTPDGTNWSTDC